MKQRVVNILFWSIISAAFIGPGTVATAASAGAGFGYSLVWALVFSTIACYVLQEASARITAVSGLNLGQAMRKEYGHNQKGFGLIYLALISVLSGCAAYEAGNVLGAVAGAGLIVELIPIPLIVLLIGFVSFLLLWNGTVNQIAIILGLVVALMGGCFLMVVILNPHNFIEVISNGMIPSVPSGSEVLVLGLIGTTVVPYGIFLGSGLKHEQTIPEMKFSMMIAIGLGGVISIAVLLAGTAVSTEFSFPALADTLSDQLGGAAVWLLGIGLFGAGLSSTLTAALAGSITAKSLIAADENDPRWSEEGFYFRFVWISILLTGLIFGLMELQPVPVIILAQALNGVILPVIAVILFLLLNNDRIVPEKNQNGTIYNLMTAVVVYLTILIGLTNISRSLSRMTGTEVMDQQIIVISSLILFMILIIPVGRVIVRRFLKR